MDGMGADGGDGSDRRKLVLAWHGQLVLTSEIPMPSEWFYVSNSSPEDWDYVKETTHAN